MLSNGLHDYLFIYGLWSVAAIVYGSSRDIAWVLDLADALKYMLILF